MSSLSSSIVSQMNVITATRASIQDMLNEMLRLLREFIDARKKPSRNTGDTFDDDEIRRRIKPLVGTLRLDYSTKVSSLFSDQFLEERMNEVMAMVSMLDAEKENLDSKVKNPADPKRTPPERRPEIEERAKKADEIRAEKRQKIKDRLTEQGFITPDKTEEVGGATKAELDTLFRPEDARKRAGLPAAQGVQVGSVYQPKKVLTMGGTALTNEDLRPEGPFDKAKEPTVVTETLTPEEVSAALERFTRAESAQLGERASGAPQGSSAKRKSLKSDDQKSRRRLDRSDKPLPEPEPPKRDSSEPDVGFLLPDQPSIGGETGIGKKRNQREIERLLQSFKVSKE